MRTHENLVALNYESDVPCGVPVAIVVVLVAYDT